MNEQIANWSQTGLLEGVPEDKQAGMAAVLESQRLFNEQETTLLPPRFMRMSIPLVRRVFHNLSVSASDEDDIVETNVTWEDKSYKDLDAEGDDVAIAAYDLCAWLKETYNKEEFKFKAFGLSNGKIAVYGLE